MYHVDYSWRNLKEKFPSWATRRNIHLGLGIMWILLLIPAFLFWKESILFVIVMSIYANVEASFAAREGASSEKEQRESRKRIEETLVKICDREEKEEESFKEILSGIATLKEEIMAVGRETQAALNELHEAIVVETEQAARKIIEATNADAATADAIREALAGVKNIIPDAPVEEPTPEPTPEPDPEPAPEPPADLPVDPAPDAAPEEDPAPAEPADEEPVDEPVEDPAPADTDADERTEE